MALVWSPATSVSVLTARSASSALNLSVEPAGWVWARISSLSPRRAGPAGTVAAAGNARVHLDGAVTNRVLPDYLATRRRRRPATLKPHEAPRRGVVVAGSAHP